jgi:hypothetical protein
MRVRVSYVLWLILCIHQRSSLGVLVDPRDDLKFDPSDRQTVEEFKDLIWY